MASLRDLVADMTAGKVDVLVVISANPVYSAPADLHFAAALDKVQLRVHLGLYEDETSAPVPLADSRSPLPRSVE